MRRKVHFFVWPSTVRVFMSDSTLLLCIWPPAVALLLDPRRLQCKNG